jgi:acyl dehydratase
MPINASAVGSEIGPFAIDVTARRCLAYAAAINDTRPQHLDDAREGGITAPAMLAVALEWPASRDLRVTPAFGATDEERLRVVHAAQDTEIHSPLRPGLKAVSKGRLVAAKRIKPGTLTVSRLTLETAAGKPLATSYSTAIYRGVDLNGDDTVEAAPPAWPDLEPQGDWTETPVPIARELPHAYTECADIWNPIHTERAVALAAGLPDIILHGTCTLAMALRELTAQRLPDAPERLKRFSCRFTGMVIPGTPIQVRHAAAEGGALFEVLNAEGQAAVREGRVLFGVGCPETVFT